ncbi:MAG: SsrA-binding protein SmpB [Alphaproteobacteria bacterium]|jgi:SsrA-binding protein|tara:strand:- start:1378 stop:1866 length:489 start_codon:yes stop_codon:yes gene_type:complete
MSSKSGGRKKSQNEFSVIADNRKAIFQYEIEDTFEAGIVLTGSEIKSIRQNKVNIKESYASAENGEIFLINCNIPRYQNSITTNYNPKRVRKLLLNKKEINKLFAATQKKGMTLIPTKMYFNKKGLAKIGIGIGKGRKIHDKREVKKTRDWERQKARLLKNN